MSQPSCAGSTSVCTTRFAVLESDGQVDVGDDMMIVTDQTIRVTFEPNLVTGEDMTQKNGCGEIHVAQKDLDVPNRYNITIQLTYPDPEIFAMLLGAPTYTSGGDVIGAQAPPLGSIPDGQENGTSFEFWTKRVGAGGQAQDYPWWHFVFPKVRWQPASRTAELAPMVTEYTGIATENVNWFNGPANDWPLDSTRVYQYRMETSQPTATCGAQASLGS